MHPHKTNGMPARKRGTQDRYKPWSDDAGAACVEVKKPRDGGSRGVSPPDPRLADFPASRLPGFLAL